jgi:hypothetical protein
MMGIPVKGATQEQVDNMSVINNKSLPESVLKKKSKSVAYHYVREAVAAGWLQIGYEPAKTNLADMLMKVQSGRERKRLADVVLF